MTTATKIAISIGIGGVICGGAFGMWHQNTWASVWMFWVYVVSMYAVVDHLTGVGK